MRAGHRAANRRTPAPSTRAWACRTAPAAADPPQKRSEHFLSGRFPPSRRCQVPDDSRPPDSSRRWPPHPPSAVPRYAAEASPGCGLPRGRAHCPETGNPAPRHPAPGAPRVLLSGRQSPFPDCPARTGRRRGHGGRDAHGRTWGSWLLGLGPGRTSGGTGT